MNIRSLTRGDGVLIGAAVVLFIASFLGISGCDLPGNACDAFDSAYSWEVSPLGWGSFLLGIAGAALVVASRTVPQMRQRKVAGLELGQVGVSLAIASAWTLLMWVFEANSAGAGLILGLIASLVLAGGAIAGPLVPALQAPLLPAAGPSTPQPYAAQPGQAGMPGHLGGQQGAPGGYGYPGAQQQPYAAQPDPSLGGGQSYGAAAQQHSQPQPQPQAQEQATPAHAQAPAADFAPFWFAVPVARPLYGEDGGSAPLAELAPGTWYLAVEQRGQALVAQTQDGRRGVLQDTTGIQRG
ncbi:hypothetical protein ACGFRB_06570 [Streptomyces sp. NPDC048718]|uniref:hypothetical protein n=1 Tax=Streptomyces sp. NPDC048718 TaxID=3365587 RepID=UPI00371D17D4